MLNVQFDGQIMALQQRGGISRYVIELANQLSTRKGVSVWLDRRWGLGSWKDITFPGPTRIAPRWMPAPVRLAATCLSSFISPACRVGTIYHPSYYLMPRRRQKGAALVVTIMDLIPERVGSGAGGRMPSWVRRRAANKADLCLCISQRTADDVHEIFGVPRDRLLVTPLGLSILPPARRIRPHDHPYILFVGPREGYKNWRLLQRAYQDEPHLHREVDIICVGGGPLRSHEQVTHGGVFQIEANDQKLSDLYHHAEVFVYPSRYEGFGLPLVEAMATGCPVVTTTGGAIPEVCGDAAFYVDADQPSELSWTLLNAIRVGRASPVAQRGPARAAFFTWERTASETLVGYRQALEMQ